MFEKFTGVENKNYVKNSLCGKIIQDNKNMHKKTFYIYFN
jgi:hypothetical protein